MKFIGNTNTNSLFNAVYTELRDAILEGTLVPGESLIETKISQELGVSRTPVREAIRQLEHDELVRTIPNKGAVVIGISVADIDDMYTIRIFTEGLAAEWATEHISDNEIEQLREIVELQEFYAVKNDYIQVWQLDGRFHTIIYDACKSRILKHVLSNFHSYVARARELSFKTEQRTALSVEEHRLIYEAMRARDGAGAKKLTEQHLINAKKSVLESIKDINA
ncbi:MAG: GntR family transcriptional regulator [Oscillospiraceae bacterium]|nr:GntR family transcriptional regulator [Oscillospiraceae bacterium]